MRANLTPEEKQSMVAMVQGLDDQTLGILWKTITTNAGGISGMDPDLLKVFYDEFERRPGLLESLTESKRRNNMKITKRQLRKIIRESIREAWNPFNEPATTLKGDPSAYSTGDQPIGKHGETMADEVLGVVIVCKPKKYNKDMAPSKRADWVYKEAHKQGRIRGYRKHSTEVAEHALEELGLSEFKRTEAPPQHGGWHMSDR